MGSKMKPILLVIISWFGTMQQVTSLFDTSFYKILRDNVDRSFAYFDVKCRGEISELKSICFPSLSLKHLILR